jgi:hypothetical protein
LIPQYSGTESSDKTYQAWSEITKYAHDQGSSKFLCLFSKTCLFCPAMSIPWRAAQLSADRFGPGRLEIPTAANNLCKVRSQADRSAYRAGVSSDRAHLIDPIRITRAAFDSFQTDAGFIDHG